VSRKIQRLVRSSTPPLCSACRSIISSSMHRSIDLPRSSPLDSLTHASLSKFPGMANVSVNTPPSLHPACTASCQIHHATCTHLLGMHGRTHSTNCMREGTLVVRLIVCLALVRRERSCPISCTQAQTSGWLHSRIDQRPKKAIDCMSARGVPIKSTQPEKEMALRTRRSRQPNRNLRLVLRRKEVLTD